MLDLDSEAGRVSQLHWSDLTFRIVFDLQGPFCRVQTPESSPSSAQAICFGVDMSRSRRCRETTDAVKLTILDFQYFLSFRVGGLNPLQGSDGNRQVLPKHWMQLS